MDDTRPLPQLDIEAEIQRQTQRLEKVTHELARRAVAAAEAEHAYKVAYARALMTAKATGVGPVAVCEAHALAECDTLLLQRLTTAAVRQGAEEAGRNARASIDALRSLNTNHRQLVTGPN